MNRRKPGIGAIQKDRLEREKFRGKGTALQEGQLEQMGKQFETFQRNLEEFALKHKTEIRKNALFRRQFQEMCAAIGVDPLASAKGFWSVLGVGDFYHELSVQIVEVCLATNEKNGGLIGLDELRDRLVKARGKGKQHQDITEEDLLAAGKKLKVLGSGFTIFPVGDSKGKRYMVQSIPGELSRDHLTVLERASNEGFVSIKILKEAGWEEERCMNALGHLLKEGLAWLDMSKSGEKLYWFPSLFMECIKA